MPRRALWPLLAAAALPFTPSLAQDEPVVQPPITDVTVPPVTTPEPEVTQPPQPDAPPVTDTTPPVTEVEPPANAELESEAPPATARRSAVRATARPTAAARAPAAARPAPAAAAPEPAETAAAAPAAEPAPAPAESAVPLPLPVPEEPAQPGVPIWTWLVGGALFALLAFAAFNMMRHRRRVDDHDEIYHDEAAPAEPVGEPLVHREVSPAAMAIPGAAGAAAVAAYGAPDEIEPDRDRGAAVPAAAAAAADEPAMRLDEPIAVPEEVEVAEADAADVEALAAASAAPAGRPWLEFLMRPIRAGTSKDSAVVEFELTVGNTGSAAARDVRVSTFMFAAGTSEMERMLIEPPADSLVDQGTIGAGEATRIEGQIALPREGLAEDAVMPVLVADASYRLPDGSEGRTRASFEIGLPGEGGLDPFPLDRTSGLLEGVEARLHGEPERV